MRPSRRWALPRFFAANVLFAAGLFAHAFLYNFYLGALGAGPAAMGLAAAMLTAGGLAALAPAGIAVDRLGPRWACVAASVLAGAGLLAGAAAESIATVYAAAFAAGAGTAAWRVAMGPATLALATGPARMRAFSWNVGLLLASGAAWTLGSGALAARLGGGLPGLRAALAAGAAGTLLAGVLFATLGLPAPPPPERTGTRAPARERIARAVRGLAVPAPVLARVGLIALWMLGAALVIPFFNLYFQRAHALPVERVGMLLATGQAVAAAAVFASGWMAGRWGPRAMLLAWVLAFAPAVWGMGMGGAFGLVFVLFLAQGAVAPATNPLIDQLLLESAPEDRRGAVSGARNLATEASGFAGAALGGWILERAGFGALFGVAGAVGWAAGLATVAAFALEVRRRRRGDADAPAAPARPAAASW